MPLRERARVPFAHWLVVLVSLALAGCAGDPAVDAVIDDLEQQLASDVAPVLAEEGATEEAFDVFFDTVRSVSTDELHVVRSGQAGGGGGAGSGLGPAHIEAVVTVVGPGRGVCLAVYVDADAAVRTLRLGGDPAKNCPDVRLPEQI